MLRTGLGHDAHCRSERNALDEFSAVAAEQVARLFGRARSAGVPGFARRHARGLAPGSRSSVELADDWLTGLGG